MLIIIWNSRIEITSLGLLRGGQGGGEKSHFYAMMIPSQQAPISAKKTIAIIKTQTMHIKAFNTLLPAFSGLILFLLLALAPWEALAQRDDYLPSTSVRAAYLGALVHPGIMLGIERPYRVRQVDKFRPRRIRTVYQERYVSFNLGMYHHQTFHTNFMALMEWSARRQYAGGFYLQTSLGAGLSRTFLHGAAYEVDGSGEVFKSPLAGDFYALASMGFGIGYQLRLGHEQPVSVFARPRLLFMAPYNGLALPRMSMELGISWSPKGFWSAQPEKEYKTKIRKPAKQ